MLVRPHYCNKKDCEIIAEAQEKEIRISVSNAQKFLDNNFMTNPECKKCNSSFKDYYTIKKSR